MLGASLLCILFFTSGCVSTLMRVVRDPLQSSSNSYPSVRMAGDSLKHPDILTPLILLDLPFSAALDTVMLPSDAANAKRSKKHNPKTKKEWLVWGKFWPDYTVVFTTNSLNFSELGWWGRILPVRKVLIPIVIGLLVEGRVESMDYDARRWTSTAQGSLPNFRSDSRD